MPGVLYVGPPTIEHVGHDVVATFTSGDVVFRMRSSRAAYRMSLETEIRRLNELERSERDNVVQLREGQSGHG